MAQRRIKTSFLKDVYSMRVPSSVTSMREPEGKLDARKNAGSMAKNVVLIKACDFVLNKRLKRTVHQFYTLKSMARIRSRLHRPAATGVFKTRYWQGACKPTRGAVFFVKPLVNSFA